ncbi:ADP-ribosyl cyclase/cyclic ADP-ribose hydrolase 1-like [Enoplosus armatus]|uniref:ADP-ribosyl cyclase/cyclic ADP-ribose hydrolase 1-like n=1 Tax=Enoplosus armatus TaxID=215367 RepID=UPI0039949EC8
MKVTHAIAIGVAVTTVVIVVVVPPAVLLSPRTGKFRETFMQRCEEFPQERQICEKTLAAFEQAYVGKESCNFPEKDYDPVLNDTPFTHPASMTMLWSKTKDLVREFTKKRDCFFILEDTLLGYVLDGQSWCGQEGSRATFTYRCERCTINPVSSFWSRASARFAAHASGEVTVMLDGGLDEPYSPDSVLARVEIPQLHHSKVTHLSVILLTDQKNCDCESLQNLRKDLHHGIGCTCKAVTASHIQNCIAENKPCGTCW